MQIAINNRQGGLGITERQDELGMSAKDNEI